MADRVEQGLSSMEPNAEPNDLVSRQALMAELEELKSPLYGYGDFNFGVDSAIFHVENAPAIQDVSAKQKHCGCCEDGKSFIGARVILGNDGRWHDLNYCPNCGAKLDGGDAP